MNRPDTLATKTTHLFLGVLAGFGLIANLHALPGGGNVTHGSATIDNSIPGEVIIDVASSRAVLEWSDYNLASGEIVEYIMANSNDAVLNIINQGDASLINGQIFANGQVFLVNTRGFVFGSNATVAAGSLIASSLAVNPDQFFAGGSLNFFASNDEKGNIINNGNLIIDQGGNVALLGNTVANNGSIEAIAGSVTLAAGEAMTLDFDGSGLLQVAVTQEVSENIDGLEDAVSNAATGQIRSSLITLEAHVAADVFTNAVNHQGVIVATQFVESDGDTVRLVGGDGSVRLAGLGGPVVVGESPDVTVDYDAGFEVVEVLPEPTPEPQPEPTPTPEPEPTPQPNPGNPANPGDGGNPVVDGGDNQGGDGSTDNPQPGNEDNNAARLLTALANSDEPAKTDGVGSTSNSSLGLYNVQSPGVRLPADQLEEEL